MHLGALRCCRLAESQNGERVFDACLTKGPTRTLRSHRNGRCDRNFNALPKLLWLMAMTDQHLPFAAVQGLAEHCGLQDHNIGDTKSTTSFRALIWPKNAMTRMPHLCSLRLPQDFFQYNRVEPLLQMPSLQALALEDLQVMLMLQGMQSPAEREQVSCLPASSFHGHLMT